MTFAWGANVDDLGNIKGLTCLSALGRRRVRGARLLRLLPLALVLAGCQLTDTAIPVPRVTFEAGDASDPQNVAVGLQLIFMLTILALAPALLVLTTGFTRIVVVLSLLRNAMGVPQLPPNQVLIGLALFLTFFVMAPVWSEVNDNALTPFLEGSIGQNEALERGLDPVREFMFRQTRENDLALFVSMSDLPQPRNRLEVPTHVLVPAFVISELKTAFQMGLFIFIPFLIIDLVVASTLISIGIFFLPPVVVSLPFEVLLFVLVDGWHLLTRSLLTSFA